MEEIKNKKTNTNKRSRGGQPGNKNAVGNRGGGAPTGNKNALKHGDYTKDGLTERLKMIKYHHNQEMLKRRLKSER
jgi:uncharacterized protein YjcR